MISGMLNLYSSFLFQFSPSRHWEAPWPLNAPYSVCKLSPHIKFKGKSDIWACQAWLIHLFLTSPSDCIWPSSGLDPELPNLRLWWNSWGCAICTLNVLIHSLNVFYTVNLLWLTFEKEHSFWLNEYLTVIWCTVHILYIAWWRFLYFIFVFMEFFFSFVTNLML